MISLEAVSLLGILSEYLVLYGTFSILSAQSKALGRTYHRLRLGSYFLLYTYFILTFFSYFIRKIKNRYHFMGMFSSRKLRLHNNVFVQLLYIMV